MSHTDRKLLAVALAQAAEAGRDRQLAVGGLTAADEDPGSGNDPLQSLLEALAYLAEVLQIDLDEIADEAFIETSYDRESDVLRIDFRAEVRPVVCVVLDPDCVYVATVGSQTGDSCVRFGDGERGRRPPGGFEKVAAVYRHGDGDGTLELAGLGLGEPIWLIAVRRDHGTLFSRVRCPETRAAL